WVAMLCALPFGLIYCDWQTAVDEETAMDPVEDAAPAGIDELRAAAERATQAISRREAELQEIIREAMESGALSERRGRELSAYLSGAASGSLSRYAIDNAIPDEIWQATSELLIAEMGERTRGLWTGDYTSRISTTDLQNPELRATLAELRERIKEIGQDSDARKRLQELSTMLREALGHVLESQGRK
ncbi:MAG: hypothetical protein OXG35_19250, partial [Acidobacteria bacterium]|nr:hypothetical protein [Acidobacteriota bacterium]